MPGGGKGLFAHFPGHTRQKKDPIFKEHDIICAYGGEIVDRQAVDRRYDLLLPNGRRKEHTAPYAFKLDADRFEDGACQRGVGTLPNNARGTRRRNNADIIVEGSNANAVAKIRATRNIYHGDEVFASYGRAYRFEDSHRTVSRRRR